MRLRISREELQKRSLFIVSPVYGGQPWGEYSLSVDRLKLVMSNEGLTWDDRQTFLESLVPRARNELAHYFLKSGFTHTLLVDADIVFTPDDALRLLALATPGSQYDVVCGAYPKKHIHWAKVRDAAKAGFADDDPSALEEFVGEFFFDAVDPTVPRSLDEPLEVKETGTGFMMVQRHVFLAIAEAHPELRYVDDWTGEKYVSFFNMTIRDQRLLSEDFDFCRLVRGLGMKVWVVPTINLGHMGIFKYQGNVSAIAALAASKESK
jgi:hypothetical protein